MKRMLLTVVPMLMFLSAARATDYHVNAVTGSNETGNGSVAAPWKTIKHALGSISGTGHTLHVAPGTYDIALGETFPILMKNGVSLVGSDASTCILDAVGSDTTVIRCVNVTDAATRVEGLTLKNGGSSTKRGGLFVSGGSVLTVLKCIITTNANGAMYIDDSSPRIVSNVIAKNTSSSSSVYAINCVSSSHAQIINNTISDNSGGILIDNASPDSIENNIIAYSAYFAICENSVSSSPGRVAYNLFYQNTYGVYRDSGKTNYYSASSLNGTVPECTANLDGDPKFIDRTNADYHLDLGSAALDAGNPNAVFNDPDGTLGDIGALYLNTPPSAPANLAAVRGNARVQLIWRRNTEPDAVRYRVYYGTSPAPTLKMDSTSTVSDTSRTYSLLNNTTYYFRVTAVDAAGNESGYSSEVSATPVPAVGGEYLPDTSTVLLLHMNETGGSTVSDASGMNNNGAASGTTIVSGRFGKARSYDTDGDQIDVPHSATLNFGTGSFTVESWINTFAISTHPHFKMDISGGNGWYTGLDVGGKLHARVMINFQDTWASGSGKQINDGTWHHIAAVFTPSSIYTYVDGVLDATASISVPGSSDNGRELTIGSSWNSFRGLLDEVRISSVMRSPSEFNVLLPPRNLVANASGTSITLSWQNGGGLAPFLRYRIYRGTDSTNVTLVDSTAQLSRAYSGLASGTRYFYRVAAVDSSGYEYSKSYAANAVTAPALGEYAPDANTVLLLHMNEGAGSPVTDGSASSNNGNANGTTFVNGRFGKCRAYTADGDQINIPNSTTLDFGTGSFTLETWINTLGYTNDGAHPFHKIGSPNNRGWHTQVYSDGSTGGFVANGSNETASGFAGRTKINDGKWHHIAVAVTQTYVTTYIDGVLDNVSTVWTPGTPDNDGTLNIGSSWNRFRGLLDEIRISNKARTPNEFNLQLPPKNCTALASRTSITLNWQQGGGLTPLMRYRIYRGTDSVNVTLVDSTSVFTYQDVQATAGTFYFYRIAAVDSTGFEGAKSSALYSEIPVTGEYQVDTSTVFLMHLNQTGGINVGDVSRNGYHGQFNGGSFVSGRFGNAFQPTSSSGIWTQNFSVVGMENRFTVEAWIKLTGQPTCGGCCFLCLPWMNFSMGTDANFWFNLTLADNSGRGLGSGNTTLTVGKWQHLAYVFDSGKASIFLNGILVSTDSYGQSVRTGSGGFNIVNYNAPDVFPGLIDEVRVSKIARMPSEFGLQLPPKNLQASQAGSAVRLQWANGGGSVPLMRYRVYRGPDSVNVTVVDSTITTSVDDATAVQGTSYVYRIAAVDSTGFEGAMSRPIGYSVPFAGEYQVDSSTVFLMHMNQSGGSVVTDVGPYGYHGQANSGSFVGGRFGNGYQPAVSGGMSVNNIPSTGLENAATLETWVKLTARPQSYSRLVSIPNMEITVNDGFWFAFMFRLADGSWNGIGAQFSNLAVGRWYHIAGTFKDGVASFYVNGVCRSTQSYGQAMMTAQGGGCIAQSDAQAFSGIVDEVRISKVARDPADFDLQLPPRDVTLSRTGSAVRLQWQNGGGQVPCLRHKIYRGPDSLNVTAIDSTDGLSFDDNNISAGNLYCYKVSAVDSTGFENNEGRAVFTSIPMVGEYQPDTSTVLLMHFNQPGASVAFDVSGNNYHGQVNGGSFAYGRFGKAYRPVNTSGISLSAIPSTGLENHVTMEAWVLLDGSLNDRFDIVSMPGMVFHLNSDYSVSFDFQLADGNWTGVGTSSAQLAVGRWYHVACTYDDGVASIFVDGVCRSTYSPVQSLKTGTGGGSLARMYSENSFSGLIDEVRVSKVVRQPEEFGFQFAPKNLTANLSNSVVHLSWQNGGGGVPLMRYRIYRGPDSVNVSLIDSAGGLWYDDRNLAAGRTCCYRVSAVDSSGFEISKGNSAYANIPLVGEYAIDTATVLMMHLDQDSGAVAVDVGPYGFRGQTNGGTFVEGRYGKAYQPSNGQGITLQTMPSTGMNEELTIEFWIKPTGYPNDWSGIVSLPTTNVCTSSDLSVAFNFTLADGTGQAIGLPSNSLKAGKWHHLAATYKNGTAKIYLNGTLSASASYGQSLRIGTGGGGLAQSNNNNTLPAIVDEIRISKVARQPSEFGFQSPSKDLTATVSNSTVHLSWQNGGGGVPLMRYRIYKGLDSLNVSLIDSVTGASYDDATVVAGRLYCYCVSAVDSSGYEISKGRAVYAIIPLVGEYAVDTSTVLLMHLDQDSGSVAGDVGPNGYHGRLSSGSFVTGRFGKAYQPASTNGIYLSNIPTTGLETQHTMEAWIKLTKVPDDWCDILGLPWTNLGINPDLSIGGGFTLADGSGQGIGTSSHTLTIGKWYHIARTYENGIAKVYINGILCSSRSYGQSLMMGTGSGSLATSNNNNIFPGCIDEVRVSKVARQPAQFGLQLQPKRLTAIDIGASIRLTWENGGGGVPLMRYRIYRGADTVTVALIDSTTGLTFDDTKAQAGEFYCYRVASVDSTGFEGPQSTAVHATVRLKGEYASDTTTVLLMHMDQTGGLGIFDESSNNYHGQMSSGSFVPGRFGKALQPGNSDGMWFNAISTVGMENQFTIELWVKFTDIKKYWSQIINISSMNMAINQDLSFNLNFNLEDGSGGGAWSPSYAMSVGKWYHIAGVFDHGYTKLYLNGVVLDSRYYDQSVRTSPGGGSIANYNYPDVLPGMVDEVRISRIARRPEEFALQLPPKNLAATPSSNSIELSWENGGGSVGCMRYKVYRGVDTVNLSPLDSTVNSFYSDTSAAVGTLYFYRVASVDSTEFEGARSIAAKATMSSMGEYQPDSSTVLLFHMNGTSATTEFDAGRFGNHGRLDRTSSAVGRFGKARQFDDQSAINLNYSTSLNIGDSDFTLEAWVKAGPQTNWILFMQKWESNHGIQFWLNGSSGTPTIHLQDESGTQSSVTGNSRLYDSKWHHIATIRKNNLLSLYVDGACEGSTDVSGLGSIQGMGGLSINNGAYLIDEVRISNRARSPEEFNLQVTPRNLQASKSGASVNLAWETGGGIVPLWRYKIYRGFDPGNLSLHDSTVSALYQDGGLSAGAKYYYRVTAVDSTGFESAKSAAVSMISSLALGEYAVDSSTVLLLHLDELSGKFAGDASSLNNNGSVTGTTITQGKFGNGRLMGSSDGVYVASATALSVGEGDFTVEAWLKSPSLNTQPMLFYKWGGNESGPGFKMFVNMNTADGKIVFTYHDGSGNAGSASSISSVTGNRWHHVVAMRQSAWAKLYIDGVLESTTSISGEGSFANSSDLSIGTGFSSAVLDEVRISSKARTPQEFNLQLRPTSLTTSVSATSITLTWQNGGGSAPLMRYRIYRGADSTSLAVIDSTVLLTYINAGLATGTKYYYRVVAVDSTGFESVRSYAVNATTQSIPVSASGLTATAVSSTRIDLSWTDNSNNEDGFKIDRKTSSTGTYTQRATVGANIKVYQDTGLTPTTEYFYQVTAYNAAGASIPSTEASATTPAAPDVLAPGPPIAPAISPVVWTSTHTYTISWTNPSDSSGIAKVWYRYDFVPTSDSLGTSLAVSVSNGIASAPVPAPATCGAHVLYFYLEDGAKPTGNKNPASCVAVTARHDDMCPTIQHDSLTVAGFNTGTPTDINISATASDPHSGLKSLVLYYREAGQSWSTARTVNYPLGGGNAAIPASDITAFSKEGVDYRIAATDSADNSKMSPTHSLVIQHTETFTRTDASGNPVTQMSVTQLPSGVSSQLAYRMFSVPLLLNNKTPRRVLEVETGLGSYNEVEWRFFRLNASDGYDEYPSFADEDAIEPGRAFFLILNSSKVPKAGPGMIVKAEDINKNGIQLKAGFNFVGNPFNFDVPVDSLSLSTNETLNNRWEFAGVEGTNSGWNPTPTVLKAWNGILLKLNSAATLRFDIADRSIGSGARNAVALKRSGGDNQSTGTRPWALRIVATRRDNGLRDAENLFGVNEQATDTLDMLDLCEPPMIGDNGLSLFSLSKEEALTHDFREPGEDGYVWDLKLQTPDRAAKVTLSFDGLDGVSLDVFLVDVDSKITFRPKYGDKIEVNSGNGGRRFRLIVGSLEFAEQNSLGVDIIPKKFVLYQNYPNPFNPETMVRYAIPNADRVVHVSLKIYNILGNEIATLVDKDQSAGYYEVKFDGRGLSSGTYFCRIHVDGRSQEPAFIDVKKLILIK